MNKFIDLSGKTFGIWKVVKFDHGEYHGTNHRHGMSYYECCCKKCGKTAIVARSHLTQGKNIRHFGCNLGGSCGII